MIASDTIMLAAAAVLAAVSWHWARPLALLVTASSSGRSTRLRSSSGSMPRQLVDDACLP